jgi:hypothetical protein
MPRIIKYILYSILLLVFGIVAVYIIKQYTKNTDTYLNYVAPYAPKSQKNWFKRPGWERFGFPYYSFWTNEGFMNFSDAPADVSTESQSHLLTQKNDNESPIMEFTPDSPAPANIYNNKPYHLLSDIMMPPRTNETISCVNSRSCYATDFDRMVDKTGNYRQWTNNYKRNYPDSCTSPYQELVLNFYKTDGMSIPSNNTGGSVSEVNSGLGDGR